MIVSRSRYPLTDRRWTVSPFKEMSWEPKSLCYVPQIRNTRSPKGRESYGDGVFVVVVGVTPHQGERESRSQGEGRQVMRC